MDKIFIVKINNNTFNSSVYKGTFTDLNLAKTTLATLAKTKYDNYTFKIQSCTVNSIVQHNVETVATGHFQNNIVNYNDKKEKEIEASNTELIWEISKSCCYMIETCCDVLYCISLPCRIVNDCCPPSRY